MLRNLVLSSLVVTGLALAAAPAQAQEGRHGIGVGAALMLDGPSGAAVTYDAGRWHLEGLFGVVDRNDSDISVGARFWYHLHMTQSSDFSVGGGIGYSHLGGRKEENDDFVSIEGGTQIRAFIAPNVAVSASVGLAIVTGDGDGFVLGGQSLGGQSRGGRDLGERFQGGLGITYFFY